MLKHGGHGQIRSRDDKTLHYPSVEAAARPLNAGSVVLDREVAALNTKGHPSFQALQHRSAHPKHAIMFYAFDVPHLNGEDLSVWM